MQWNLFLKHQRAAALPPALTQSRLQSVLFASVMSLWVTCAAWAAWSGHRTVPATAVGAVDSGTRQGCCILTFNSLLSSRNTGSLQKRAGVPATAGFWLGCEAGPSCSTHVVKGAQNPVLQAENLSTAINLLAHRMEPPYT